MHGLFTERPARDFARLQSVPVMSSQYMREDSRKEDGNIRLDLVYTTARIADPLLVLWVEDRQEGRDPGVKAIVDDVASECFDVLVSRYGSDNVDMVKRETHTTFLP